MRRKDILIVDGYNMIGSWPELVALKNKDEIQEARDLLLFELSNYRKYRQIDVIVVFDAQFVPGVTSTFEEFEIQVVFTKEGETADSYIEREVSKYINPITRVIVATSDMAEQWLVFQRGALRQSANELKLEIDYAKKQIKQEVQSHYNATLRRRSPWEIDQLERLDEYRQYLENFPNEDEK
ncbi:NYN domain-containing protein [Fundicoccus culcitae]|uniref:NYN domain-containing protein n=1 Tax=Fundicoccus culcitae TaxID=2969821 RepID=A0ABY5P2U1_9LACT|nr:NYN domain-containing protein [Fundicoccus culcitae]UUX33039.1 NYN domain-containing protein [Fundicoccus culcitae]